MHRSIIVSAAATTLTCAAAGQTVNIDFDDIQAGTPFFGTEYQDRGVTITSDGSLDLTDLSVVLQGESPPNVLASYIEMRAIGDFIFTFDEPIKFFGIRAIDIGEGGYRVEYLRDGEFVQYEVRTGFGTGTNQFYDINLRLDNFGESTTQVRISQRDRAAGAAAGDQYFFDNLSYTFIPAPTSAALLAIGGLAMIRRRR